MPIKYKYNAEQNIVYTYCAGEISFVELQEYFETIFSDSEIKNDFWEIVNANEVRNVTFTYLDCVKLLPMIKHFASEKGYRGAMLYAPNKHSISVIKLLVTVLSKFTSQKFFIEQNLDVFKMIVLQQVDIAYELDTWDANKNT